MISSLLFIPFIWFSLDAPAQLELQTRNGKEVTLDGQSRKYLPMQNGGFCHVYALTRLIEASCKRNFGFDIDISEDYLILKHLSANIKREGTYDLSKERKKIIGAVTYFDGGSSWDQLNSILQTGDLKLESEFSLKDGYFDEMRSVVEAHSAVKNILPLDRLDNNPDQLTSYYGGTEVGAAAVEIIRQISEVEDRLKMLTGAVDCDDKAAQESQLENEINMLEDEYLLTMDSVESELLGVLKNKIEEPLLNSDSAGLQNSDSASYAEKFQLNLCLKGMSIEGEHYSERRAINLIKNGIPFLCGGRMNVGLTTGNHISMRNGYRPNPSFENGIEWRHFDSATGTEPSWGWEGGCDDGIIFLLP